METIKADITKMMDLSYRIKNEYISKIIGKVWQTIFERVRKARFFCYVCLHSSPVMNGGNISGVMIC